MCSHYQAVNKRERYQRHFGVAPPDDFGKYDLWPGYVASFIRRHTEADVGNEEVPEREALAGRFGLVPHWAKDEKFGRRTFNARSETAATLPSFRDAWRKCHRCIIPAEAIFEPDWRSGKWLLQLAKTDVLLLDDWGMGGIDTQTRADLLEIIDDRAANKATIITSQLPIEHWHAWVGDATIADAILDRVMQRNHRFTLTGESLRQKPKSSKKEVNPEPS